jgi:hypothetical protein
MIPFQLSLDCMGLMGDKELADFQAPMEFREHR